MARQNGVKVFAMELKQSEGNNTSIEEAMERASFMWEHMTSIQRKPYYEQANTMNRELSNQLKIKRQQENADKRRQEVMVKVNKAVTDCVVIGKLDVQHFYFIMVNYFVRSEGTNFILPAEIAVAKYALREGVIDRYHSCINPIVEEGVLKFESQRHAEVTHRLPLPPNALGEMNLPRIYRDILEFIYDKKKHIYPPVYTIFNRVDIVRTVLNSLMGDILQHPNVKLDVQPIQYLFFCMKEHICLSTRREPPPMYMTNMYFNKDRFEYAPNISCKFHEGNHKYNYCALSWVTRWSYTFSDYLCPDLQIEMKRGRHVPQNMKTNIELERFFAKNVACYEKWRTYTESEFNNWPSGTEDNSHITNWAFEQCNTGLREEFYEDIKF